MSRGWIGIPRKTSRRKRSPQSSILTRACGEPSHAPSELIVQEYRKENDTTLFSMRACSKRRKDKNEKTTLKKRREEFNWTSMEE